MHLEGVTGIAGCQLNLEGMGSLSATLAYLPIQGSKVTIRTSQSLFSMLGVGKIRGAGSMAV
jgi:hypothetical protein